MKFTNLEIHYLDNNPHGVRIFDIEGSLVQAVVFPRDLFTDAKKLCQDLEFSSHGIYFLVGYKDGSELPVMYAGKTENGPERFYDHRQRKDYWDLAILFLAKGPNFGRDVIALLEQMAIEAISASKRYQTDNRVVPIPGGKKSKRIVYITQTVDKYFSDIKFIMGALGWSLDVAPELTREDQNNLWRTTRNGIVGFMRISGGQYEVLPGSTINMGKEPIQNEMCKRRRMDLKASGDMEKIAHDKWRLKKVVEFKSPSSAAVFVLGGSVNGWEEWKNGEGKKLLSIRDRLEETCYVPFSGISKNDLT